MAQRAPAALLQMPDAPPDALDAMDDRNEKQRRVGGLWRVRPLTQTKCSRNHTKALAWVLVKDLVDELWPFTFNMREITLHPVESTCTRSQCARPRSHP
jgi:hypothetical protein